MLVNLVLALLPCLGPLPAPAVPIVEATPDVALDRTMEQVRAIRAGRADVPVVVRLHDGVYRLSAPLVLTDRDSYTTFEAASGAHPRLCGAVPVTGWKHDQSAYNLVAPWPAGLKAPPQALFYAGPHWGQGYESGAFIPRSYAPAFEWFTVDGPIENVWTWGPGGKKENLVPSRFRYREGDIKPEWVHLRGLEVVAILGWAEVRMPVTSIDPATRTITLAGTLCPSNREENCRYRLEGISEPLYGNGHWSADSVARTLSYYNGTHGPLYVTESQVPVTDELVRIQGDALAGKPARDIFFRGITFSMSGTTLPPNGYVDVQAAFDVPAAIQLESARDCRFDRCEFGAIANWAVSVGAGCSGNTFSTCLFRNLGAGGIKIGEFFIRKEAALACRSNTVSDCVVERVGNLYFGAPGIWIGQSGGNTISHNRVSETRSSGISVGWSWRYEASAADHNAIEYNLVQGISHGFLSDLGGIYTLGIQPGTVIRGNVVSEVRSRKGGGWGIYLDEGSSGILVEGNLVYNTTSAGFFLHYGRGNTVVHNAFINSDEPNILRFRDEGQPSFTFARNLVVAKGGLPLGGDWGHQGLSMHDNLYWSSKRNELRFDGKSFAQWQAAGYDAGSAVKDPGASLYQGFVPQVAAGSPAEALLGRGGWAGAGPRAR